MMVTCIRGHRGNAESLVGSRYQFGHTLPELRNTHGNKRAESTGCPIQLDTCTSTVLACILFEFPFKLCRDVGLRMPGESLTNCESEMARQPVFGTNMELPGSRPMTNNQRKPLPFPPSLFSYFPISKPMVKAIECWAYARKPRKRLAGWLFVNDTALVNSKTHARQNRAFSGWSLGVSLDDSFPESWPYPSLQIGEPSRPVVVCLWLCGNGGRRGGYAGHEW